MISLSKKQIIFLIILALFILGSLAFYFYYYSSFSTSSEDIDLMSNILENPTENVIENTTDESETSQSDNVIFIHITGCIISPGLISLPEGSRIADAISKAGGITEDADLSQINLAYILEDGLKLYIPSYGDSKQKTQTLNVLSQEAGANILIEDTLSSSSTNEKVKVNINTATQTELETIPGVGPSTALKIITYRKENGSFNKIEDIQNVKGIGEAKYEEMKESICVK